MLEDVKKYQSRTSLLPSFLQSPERRMCAIWKIKNLHPIVLAQPCNYNSFHSSGKAFKKGFWEFLTSLLEATMLEEVFFAVSSQRCSIRLTSRFCDGHSSFSTSNSLIHVFVDLDLCNKKEKGVNSNLCPQIGTMTLSKLVCRSIGSSFHWE